MNTIIKTLVPLLKGLAKTFSYIFKKPVTFQYPEKKREVSERWRGLHRLKTENGKLKCVACGLCEAVCPADVIKVERRETPDGRSFPVKFEVTVTRCIFCGYCQEACPKDAIELTRNYEFCDYTREDFDLSRDMLAKIGE
ncbi:MAG: NADH-quinone oxidoreductase subunit I [Deltaproteobacteria bacterium]|nr:MAG: NADH-quinone oxidoreductase subunit I [Deltaproteobacteria bacterium]